MARRAILTLVLATLWSAGSLAAQEPLRAQAVVEKQQVFVGEPFLYQIRVDGSESPAKPDLSALTGFTIEDAGGSQNSSTSMTIINGRMSRVVKKGYVFNYRLVAGKAGTFTIPAITIKAKGQTARTNPIVIRAVPPRETSDLKLRLSLSAKKAYIGEPVIMTVTWYVGKNVRNFTFNMPVLADPRFDFGDPTVKPDPDRHIQFPVGGGQVVAEKGEGTLDGRRYLTVRFRKILTPKQAGRFVFPSATVAGQAVKGYQRRRNGFGSFFDDDFFGLSRQEVLESFVIPSNQPVLEVLDLPAAGRPKNFSGLIGEFKITAEATPTKVNVGDPITITLHVSGPSYLDNVKLPPLGQQPALARDFKIPQERASGVVKGRSKDFTQTLRARHSDVQQIPPIELAYFNPKSGSYEIARSNPIPLEVEGTRILTARDAEGVAEIVSAGSEVESAAGGIAYNYEGPDVLANQAYGPAAWRANPGWLMGLAFPPLVYFGVLGLLLVNRWRDADPAARRARQGHRRLKKALGALQPADTDEFYAGVLQALRHYLGDRLGLTAGALTIADVEPILRQRGVNDEAVRSLRRIYERCEAGRYAGAAFGDEQPAGLRRATLETVRQIEEAIK